MKILISRTDSIGDVVLTLPMAGVIKRHFPNSEIQFLGRTYTQPVIERCLDVDHFLNRDENPGLTGFDCFIHVRPDPAIARLAWCGENKIRIGTSHRVYHWWTCNRLVNLGRKTSDLHEAQLNVRLLTSLRIKDQPSIHELFESIHWKTRTLTGNPELTQKYNLVFHPKSGGSAGEWPLIQYFEVAKLLSGLEFQVFITGTKSEGDIMRMEAPLLFDLPHVSDMTGRFTLSELIDFIGECDGMVAGSTGPLHIASVMGLETLGLYPSKRPMHAGRWRPIGPKSQILTSSSTNGELVISVEDVLSIIKRWVR